MRKPTLGKGKHQINTMDFEAISTQEPYVHEVKKVLHHTTKRFYKVTAHGVIRKDIKNKTRFYLKRCSKIPINVMKNGTPT